MNETDTQTEYISQHTFDAIVVGAGHAGVEAALALARQNKSTLLLTLSLNAIAFMACNPNIGGTAKGHLAREIDALGGEMGKTADFANIQLKMLNRTGGCAVHSLRGQMDKKKYQARMKHVLETTPNLVVLEAEASAVLTADGAVTGAATSHGEIFFGRAVVLACGVYLDSKIIVGEYQKNSGPQGFQAATELSKSLLDLGLEIVRFKTGTPARVLKSSLDLNEMEVQKGEDDVYGFSFLTEGVPRNTAVCYLTYTNEKTHKIILDNLSRAPLYNGSISGVGPRYCPSIEDKVKRFSDKNRHQIFIEPEGADTDEMYVQGLSTSMPYDIQLQMIHSIKGMEHARVLRYGYAIEYDAVNPHELTPYLMTKKVKGLFLAGQINGSSGYEEAGAQGLMAGINARLYLDGEPPFILGRDEAYIGVLIDDLVTKGTEEPYRMMTARAEYRLQLRQDNADLRLTEKGFRLGLAGADRLEKLEKKRAEMELIRAKLKRSFPAGQIAEFLKQRGESEPKGAVSGEELLKRANVNYKDLIELMPELAPYENAFYSVQAEIKYEGYLAKEQAEIKEMRRLESKMLPEGIDYAKIKNLRLEARQKLQKIRPISLGQASRISGVSPADIVVLMVYLRLNEENGN